MSDFGVSMGQALASQVTAIDGQTEAKAKELAKLKKACDQFESVFVKQLLGEMEKGIPQNAMGDQAGSAIYKDMMDQSIADAVAKQGSLGISKMLFQEFSSQMLAEAPSETNGQAAAVAGAKGKS